MNNRNKPDHDPDEQERLERELREQQQRALRDQLSQSQTGMSDFDPGDEGKDPVIINRDR